MIKERSGDFLQWLRGFYYVAKRRSFTKAALDMGRNQPTISQQIKCLENELGVTLFDRSGGKIGLTTEGESLLAKAISVFEIIRAMESIGKQSQYEGIISIVSTHAVINYFLPGFITDFRKKSPDVRFILEGGMSGNVMEKIESAEADFGIVNIEQIPDQIVYHELFETGMSLIVPKKNPSSWVITPDLKEIAKAPFIMFPETSNIAPLIRKKFTENRLHLNVVLTLNNFQSIKKYVAMGIGVSILDENMIVKEEKKAINVFSLDHIFEKRKYLLITRKGKYLSPVVKAFIHTMKPDLKLD
jgi:DNA-binding transcriptional LysR family regulator